MTLNPTTQTAQEISRKLPNLRVSNAFRLLLSRCLPQCCWFTLQIKTSNCTTLLPRVKVDTNVFLNVAAREKSIEKRRKSEGLGNDELERQLEEKSDVVIIQDKLPKKQFSEKDTKEMVVLPPTHFNPASNFYIKTPPIKPRHCRKVDYFIDFEKIGWGDWIIFPKHYNAYKCVGECRIPLTATKKPTNHAFIQSLLAVNRPASGVGSPCCVPTKLLPMSILYYEDGVVKQREHDDMIVAECDCR